MHNIVKDNRGVVPLLTSVFLGILLSIVAVAFVRLAISERRQATDDDLSTAAFYAAESGLEDAKRAIKQHIDSPTTYRAADLRGNSCDAAKDVDSGLSDNTLDADYTCQIIDLSPNSLLAKPGANNGHLFKLDAVDDSESPVDMSNIVIKWNDVDTDDTRSPRPASNTTNLHTGAWTSSNYPAMLRVNLFAVRRNNIRLIDLRNTAESLTGFINPVNVNPTNHSLTVEQFDSQLLRGGCRNGGGSFLCEANLDLTDTGQTPASLRNVSARYRSRGWVVYAHITTLYQDDTVQVQVQDASGNFLGLAGSQARIDVTGRSGDSFRRVETYVPLEKTANALGLPNYTVVGGDRICKDFLITNSQADYYALNPGINSGNQGSCVN